jgi:hypothetical protein
MNVGELPGIGVDWLPVVLATGGAVASLGLGLTCSAVTSNRLVEVPIGVQVISVRIGLSVV